VFRAARVAALLDATAEVSMEGQGSTGNVIAAVCSFFVPGLGQLVQGRVVAAIIQFVLAGALWVILMGWAVHLYSIIDAARYKARPSY
jgi:TM2 domain-containing membrane protein YozV